MSKIQHKEVSPFLNESNLHNYQKNTIQFVKDNNVCGLFLDMGL